MMLWNVLLSPIFVTFVIIILGCAIGKIKVFGISLDVSGVLIVAILTGFIFDKIALIKGIVNTIDFQRNMSFLSTLGVSLFVSVIGITAGYTVDIKKKAEINSVFIGSLMAASSFIVMRIIACIDKGISISRLLGLLSGSLTTTPGLSAAIELQGIDKNEVTIGYGTSYFIGVLLTVLFVQIIAKNYPNNTSIKSDSKDKLQTKNDFSLIMQIGFVICIGKLIGNMKVWGLSLGDSGGILCSGIILGCVFKKLIPQKIYSKEFFGLIRNLGLVLFFVGNGLPAGMKLDNGFEIKMIGYSLIFVIMPMLFGVLTYKILNSNKTSAASVISGGMTSTPAMGVLIHSEKSFNLTEYSASYIGALLTIIVLMRIQV